MGYENEMQIPVPLPEMSEQYIRIRALEFAIQSKEPDGQLQASDVLTVAERFYKWIMNGPTEPPELKVLKK